MILRQIPIASRFATSIIVAFPCRREDLQPLISPRFSVDEINGSGYFAIAIVDQVETRPKGMPPRLGKRLSMIEYLVFASYTGPSGQALSGLVMVHSETDSRLAAWFGGLVSPYGFSRVDLDRTISPSRVSISSKAAQLMIEAKPTAPEQNATETLGGLAAPRSFNFVDLGEDKGVLINRGILKGWLPTELDVGCASSGWLNDSGVAPIGPPRGLMVRDVRYLFKRHRIDEPA